jgi:hypothetical protein
MNQVHRTQPIVPRIGLGFAGIALVGAFSVGLLVGNQLELNVGTPDGALPTSDAPDWRAVPGFSTQDYAGLHEIGGRDGQGFSTQDYADLHEIRWRDRPGFSTQDYADLHEAR